jgi:hypothetical protein
MAPYFRTECKEHNNRLTPKHQKEENRMIKRNKNGDKKQQRKKYSKLGSLDILKCFPIKKAYTVFSIKKK